MRPWHSALTPREREAVRLVACGRSNGGIARTLGISEHTAKFHVNRAITKARAVSRAHLAALATIAGLVDVAAVEAARYQEPAR